jgi:hypothetical protein
MRNEKIQINKIKNEKGNITTNIKEIQGMIRDYFENLYSKKLENLEEMEKFLDTYDHPKFNEDSIYHLKIFIKNLEVEAKIVCHKGKVQDLTDSLLNSIRPLMKNQYQHSSNVSI